MRRVAFAAIGGASAFSLPGPREPSSSGGEEGKADWMRNALVIAACTTLVAAGCSGGGGGGSAGGGAGPKAAAGYIEIPDCDRANARSLRINNRGLYVKCDSTASGGPSTIHRLELGGPSPSWYTHKPGFYVTGFEPTKRDTEKTDEFSIFWFTLKNHGYFSVNSDSPASEAVNPNTGVSNIRHMLVDNSPSANTWAFIYGGPGWEVWRISPISTGGAVTFEKLVPAPAPGAEYVEADDSDAFVWAGLGTKLAKISITKTVEEVDLSTAGATNPITKIRVKNGDAWVQAGRKLFRVKSPTDVKLFATIASATGMTIGGSFAVDDNFVYLTDGRKINVDSGAESEFFSTTIAPSSGTSVDDIMMRTEFQSSMNLEVSSDSLDSYVYMVSTSKGPRILRVGK